MRKLTPEQKNKIVTDRYGEHFCAAPFTSLYEGPDGRVATCCKTTNALGYTSENTLEEIANSKEAQRVRKQFLAGEKPDQCRACWNQEKSGKIASNRLHSNNLGFDTINKVVKRTNKDGYMKSQHMTWLDLLWTNKCNFACLGCSPVFSSTIDKNFKEEFSVLHDRDYNQEVTNWNTSNDNKIDYVLKHADSIHTIHLNGGEPLMSEDLYEFLEALIKKGLHKKITLWSHTNGSVKKYKGKDLILDYFSQWGNKCKITLSNDGHGKYGEYIRYGYTDKKWLETYSKIKEAKVHCKIQTCVNVFNVLYLDEMNDWYLQNTSDHLGGTPYGALTLWTDKTVNIKLLNHIPELRKQALTVFEGLQNKKTPRWNKSLPLCYNWLKNDDYAKDHNLECFYKGVTMLDKKRGTDFLDTFPKLEPLWNLAKTI